MKVFNSLTRQLEELEPIHAGKVGLYTCGPTVYDHVHIGNLRTYVFEDTLRRALKLNGYKVSHVMNITDVDDKTIKRSRERYSDKSPTEALSLLTEHYTKLFLDDAAKLGVDFDDSEIAKATEHIEEMKDLIGSISNRYIADDGVYYNVEDDSDYGQLVSLDRAHVHHRINNDEYDKDHVADFALWKVKSEGEPSWPFELDGHDLEGRPGWHIECSAMAVKYLGQPFDIHTGGVDLKFPHHENEIAQSRAGSGGKQLAQTFMHAEHLLVDGRKMSKKLNNFYTLRDVEEKAIDLVALRLLFLQAHYRTQLDFGWESLQAAAANLNALRSWADLIHQNADDSTENDENIEELTKDLNEALRDDLNTPKALAVLNSASDKFAPTPALLKFIDEALGLNLSNRKDISEEQKSLIAQREEARADNDWQKADEFREVLKQQGIELRDSTQGALWSRL